MTIWCLYCSDSDLPLTSTCQSSAPIFFSCTQSEGTTPTSSTPVIHLLTGFVLCAAGLGLCPNYCVFFLEQSLLRRPDCFISTPENTAAITSTGVNRKQIIYSAVDQLRKITVNKGQCWRLKAELKLDAKLSLDHQIKTEHFTFVTLFTKYNESVSEDNNCIDIEHHSHRSNTASQQTNSEC